MLMKPALVWTSQAQVRQAKKDVNTMVIQLQQNPSKIVVSDDARGVLRRNELCSLTASLNPHDLTKSLFRQKTAQILYLYLLLFSSR